MKFYENVVINDNPLEWNSVKSYMSEAEHETESIEKMLLSPIVTHSGMFHADEVFSIALIYILRNATENKEVRCRETLYKPLTPERILKEVKRIPSLTPGNEEDERLYKECLVLDLRNGHYDHHHENIDDVPSCVVDGKVTKLATIAQIWNDIGHLFNVGLSNRVFQRIWESLILPISMQDQYGLKYRNPISEIISNINGYTELDFDFVHIDEYADEYTGELFESVDINNLKFAEAVMMAYKILHAKIVQEQLLSKCIDTILDDPNICFNTINNVKVCVIKKVEGVPEPRIKLEALKYLDVETPDVLINEYESFRDGMYRVIMIDTDKVKIDQKFIKEPLKGQKFLHNQLFMITFDSIENLYEFINNSQVDNGILTVK